mmetsp:Transcript_33844/g.85989  ORF Transcript_33844/g.85989 Transcript_33844/m.85989 type:complete len:269 (+) Transcript_33844:82-888(+)
MRAHSGSCVALAVAATPLVAPRAPPRASDRLYRGPSSSAWTHAGIARCPATQLGSSAYRGPSHAHLAQTPQLPPLASGHATCHRPVVRARGQSTACTSQRSTRSATLSSRRPAAASVGSPNLKAYSEASWRKYSTFCFMLSLDSPATRSRKVIGTSTTAVHRHRTMSSRPILKPIVLTPASALRASVALRRQKKPDIGSDERESGHASEVAPAEMMRRTSDHSKPRPPPPTLREPTAKSALPAKTGAAMAGTASGSCCRSASMQSTAS